MIFSWLSFGLSTVTNGVCGASVATCVSASVRGSQKRICERSSSNALEVATV